jgi:hypothetical protein
MECYTDLFLQAIYNLNTNSNMCVSTLSNGMSERVLRSCMAIEGKERKKMGEWEEKEGRGKVEGRRGKVEKRRGKESRGKEGKER